MIKKTMFAVMIATILAIPFIYSSAAILNSNIAVPPVSVTTLPIACYPFNRSLSIGASGSDVTALQNYLAAQGYFHVTSTGYFGAITKAAVGSWQAQNGVATLDNSGSGIFGPLSRNLFIRACGGNGNSTSTPSTESFSANPQSGSAPLTVQFIASAPQGTTLGNAVSFGDGAQGNLGVVPVCSHCNAEGIVSHTYTNPGTYTATLTNGNCSCPMNEVCNCPNIQIIATTTVVVGPANTATSTTALNIQQLNSPGNATLSLGGIAEIRNESAYFTLESIASSSATIQITPVGCWNSFPSDPEPKILCMIAMIPIPPQIFTLGQVYTNGNYSITLTQLTSSTATFAVQ